MSQHASSYEQMAESGDLTSTFDFSEKSIRHGSIEMINFHVICVF